MNDQYLSVIKNVFWSIFYQRSYQATIWENIQRETCDRKLKDISKCKGLIEELSQIKVQPVQYDLTAYDSEPKQFQFKDISVVTFGKKEKAKQLIYFIHGGGWLFDFDPVHFAFCDKLAKDLDAYIVAPSYLLAPHFTFEQSIPTLIDLYSDLIKDWDKSVSILGDSAGGQISLSLTMIMSKKGMKLPNQIIAISPVVDASMSINQNRYAKYEKLDPILGIECIKMIADKFVSQFELTDYRISPYYFDQLSLLPKTTFIVGTHEIFYPDVCSFHKKLCLAGVKSQLIVGRGLNHDFIIYHDIPESRKVYHQICDILN